MVYGSSVGAYLGALSMEPRQQASLNYARLWVVLCTLTIHVLAIDACLVVTYIDCADLQARMLLAGS